MMRTKEIVVRIMVRDASVCCILTNAPLASMMRMNSVAHLICKPANCLSVSPPPPHYRLKPPGMKWIA